MSGVLGIIPARIGSTRLSRKPLRPLLGVPLIAWVLDRARKIPILDRLLVATDDETVAEICRSWGGEVVMTRADHPSGTDRVEEAASTLGRGYDIVVNIQGDEPLVESGVVLEAVAQVTAGFDVGTCATPIGSESEFADPAVVKVVRASDGRGLYFSRAPIPFRRDEGGPDSGPPTRLRHVGIYAYRRAALERWVRLEPSPLEREERLEQLRALEAGLTIGVGLVDYAGVGVDTAEDLARLEQDLKRSGTRAPTRPGGNQQSIHERQ
ncbi:MAG: 3-deoxy-manno-octulosonate cytidylyltransferase [Gemmatimonadetes bacterium]|nr:3-deoxy-manno-octulosonate cytidylyltransferase [Gemmatimonadota bacterium]